MRSRQHVDPVIIYIGLSLGGSLLLSLAFTTNLLYYVETVGLDPLQMVLMGTVLEGTILLFEVPTGVVADMRGRKVSIVIGHALTGAAFCLQAVVPHLWAVALAQAVWGIGYTFTSGAQEAWLADEVGPDRAPEAFSRAGQAAQLASLAGIGLAAWVGAADLALPILVCGLGYVVLALALLPLMCESGYRPSGAADWSGWREFADTAARAVRLAGRRQVLVWLLVSGVVLGLYSEGYDRLWMPHMLQGIGLPDHPELPTTAWFAGIRMGESLLGIGAVELARRRLLSSDDRRLSYVLSLMALGVVLGIAGVAWTRSFWVAAAAAIGISALRGVSALLRVTWLNRQIDDSSVRATLFSAIGQADSLGQVAGGPAVGWVARALSVPAGLTMSALLLTPILPIYALSGQRGAKAPGADD